MVDSTVVLWGQTIAYTAYVLVILAVMAWFAFKVTRGAEVKPVKSGLFYSFVGLLVVLGVSLHILPHETIPWKPLDLNRAGIKADQEFNVVVANHSFRPPTDKLVIKTNQLVRFNVTSEDLTYGFGLFRQDNTMVFQMQVIPGHQNDILWKFDRPAVYSIRSTEYSGWKGINMVVRDAVQVID